MAVTRREFVTTLGMLAAAAGMSQTDLAKITEAFAHAAPWGTGDWTNKPKVVWVHGAECTGCSTSLLSLYEDAAGVAIPGFSVATGEPDTTTAQALAAIGGGGLLSTANAVTALSATSGSHPYGHRTLNSTHLNVEGSAYAVNIADVLIDFLDVQYHETVMAAGGDGAYAYLRNEMDRTNSGPFVLVVEGAVQKYENAGYWNKPGTLGAGGNEDYNMAPWCSIAADGRDAQEQELSFDRVVRALAGKGACKAVVAIGQCATFGGYPACQGPDLTPNALGKSMTGAKGVYDYLIGVGDATSAAKVVNVPGCPVNPWWFTLSVVAWLVDVVTGPGKASPTAGALGILNSTYGIVGGVDATRRLTAVYGDLLHGKYCPRYPKYAMRIFAAKPGDDGCLKNIGCKGLSTKSSCGRHGWNNAQPQNAAMNASGAAASSTTKGNVAPLYNSNTYADPAHLGGNQVNVGGCCMTAGAPCMGCTEKGYPDAMTPFVVR